MNPLVILSLVKILIEFCTSDAAHDLFTKLKLALENHQPTPPSSPAS